MNMKYGITADGFHSYRDYGLHIKEKDIGLPAKALNRKAVPYRNGSYDFSTLGGDPVWGDREIVYKFDILEDSERAMNASRDSILNWLSSIHEAEIIDDAMPDYHFIGSYADGEITDEIEASEITAKFICYPFRIANYESSVRLNEGENQVPYLGQATTAYIQADAAGSVTIDGYTQSFAANVRTELPVSLSHGMNTIVLACSGIAHLYYTKEII